MFVRKRANDFPYLILHFCFCKSICNICLQKHHVALCPKRDRARKNWTKSDDESIDFLNLEYGIIFRFLTLCNPVDKMKLEHSCKNLKKSQTIKYEFHQLNYYKFVKKPVIYIGTGTFDADNDPSMLAENAYFNLHTFHIENRIIKKSDLSVLCKSDPISIRIYDSRFEDGLSFSDFFDNIRYTIELELPYNFLPTTWIKDFIKAKRNVNLRYLLIHTTVIYPEFDVNELVQLFEINKDLTVWFLSWSNVEYQEASKKIKALMKHERIYETIKNEDYHVKFDFRNCSFKFAISLVKLNKNER